MKYFVMLVHNGTSHPLPLLIGEDSYDDRLALFDTEEQADTAGADHPMGIAAGYEVYPWSHQG